MIYRNILFKINRHAGSTAMACIQNYVARIRVEIPDIKTYHFAANKGAGADGYNWVLFAAFPDETAMNAYREHPLHREFVAYCDQFTDEFVACFYDAPGGQAKT